MAYDLLVEGKGEHSSDMALAMQEVVRRRGDRRVREARRADRRGRQSDRYDPAERRGDLFNYRNDRAKELTIVLTQEDMPQQGMHTLPLYYCCMTPYDAKFEGAAYPVRQGERGRHDRRVCRPAGLAAPYRRNGEIRSCGPSSSETEKYAHVTSS